MWAWVTGVMLGGDEQGGDRDHHHRLGHSGGCPKRPHTPTPHRAWRTQAVAGFVFVAAEVACIAIQGGATPSRRSAAPVIGNYFRHHAGRVEVSEVIAALGVGALLWWSGGLRSVLRSSDSWSSGVSATADAALTIGLALGLVDISLFATAGVAASSVSDGSLVLLYDSSTAAILLSGVGIAIFLAAVCRINSRVHVLPAWTNYVGWAASGGFIVGVVGIGSSADVWLLAGYAAFLTWCAWTLGVSASMFRRGG